MDSRIIVGVDEAGYGPNIGPLVIAATVWKVPQALALPQLNEVLFPTFAAKAFKIGDGHIPIGDSKILYSPASGLLSLEAGVLAMLGQLEPIGNDLIWLVRSLCSQESLECLTQWPWYQSLTQTVQQELPVAEILRLQDTARKCLNAIQIELLQIKATMFSDSAFNSQISKLGSKGQLLSTSSLKLAHDVACKYDCQVDIFCDRQGGRKKYLPVLLQTMPERWFETIVESDKLSSYRTLTEPRWTFHFTVGGEQFAPVGLASMTAKFVRERMMHVLNAYWQRQIPGVQPTAGYPQDAKRFRLAIETTAISLGFPESTWWRVC